MKKVIFSLALLLTCSLLGYAQKGISYQAVILDPKPIEIPGQDVTGQPFVNGNVSLKFKIFSSNLVQEFEEVHATQTDAYGMVNVLIGSVSQGAFSSLVWDSKQKSLQVLVSFDQGGTYTKVSEQVLTYNPMALFAETAGKLGGTLGIASGGTGATTAAAARTNLGLGNVDNTADVNKPVSSATQNALDSKVDKATGKQLSTNDFSTEEKTKLAAITGTNTGDQDLSAYATTKQLATKASASDVITSLASKVDKEVGKGLSSNDYTTEEKIKLAAISGNGAVNVPGATGAQGPQGLTGATGPAGPAGPQGAAGLPGATGPQGPIGLTGPAGLPGATGANGKTVANGTTDPATSTGVDGDFYINTATNTLFGPKANGTWPTGVSLVGPTGATGPTGSTGAQGPQGIQGLTGATGAAGAQGIQGLLGAQGATGPQGPTGATGTNGKTVANGTTDPATSTGVDGDFYINTATNTLFGPKASGAWPTGVSLVGPTGATGPTGPTGAQGIQGPQGIQGVAGATGAAGAQGIQGLTGATGPTGANGAQGATGANGKTVANGTTDPATSTGVDGDFYINTATNTLFGPKASGTWPTGVSLVGPTGATGPTGPTGAQGIQGPQGIQGLTGATGAAGAQGIQGVAGATGATGATGPIGAAGGQGIQGLPGAQGATGPQGPTGATGANGKTVANGTTDPATSTGVDGDFYINTATNTLFGPKASGAWPTGVSLVGPTGPTGAQGIQGPQGIQGLTGATGLPGATGATGAQGIQGLTGATGAQGIQGLTGATGAVGAQGIQGVAGATGATGATGPAPSGTGIVTVSSGTLQTPGALTGDVTTSAAGLVTSIATGAVTSDKLLDGTIATADLANSAVTDAKIAGMAGSKVSGNITGNAANVTGTVAVANGGTGATTLTANNVLLGNGTSALQAVAPGTSGNVLTSNGTTWASTAPSGGGLPTTGNTAGDMLYWNGTAWVKVAAGSNNKFLVFVNGAPTWAPIVGATDVYNPSTGKVWMDRNLGASRVATSSTDYLAYGSIYQWGRGNDGHQLMTFTSATAGSGQNSTSSTLSTTDTPGNSLFILSCPGANNIYDWRNTQNNNLWQGASGTNNPCPSGYRLPTEAEWLAESATWGTLAAGAFASVLKLPVPGVRSCCGGGLEITGTGGIYWSSTVSGTQAKTIGISATPTSMFGSNRADGRSVRCIKD
jgi:hypothetical protein